MPFILIVEDEVDLAESVEYTFRREGFDTRVCHDGKSALAAIQDRRPDAVMLDLMLPDLSGTEVCRQIRSSEETRGVPVIMVTAKGEELDRVVGFEVGADDYVVKPFSVRELVLRVRAVLRRSGAATPSGGTKAVTPELQFGDIRIDRAGHRVFVKGDEVGLTALEFRLLDTFIERKGRVQSRQQLLSDVWEYSATDIPTRTVDTHIKRLREKLGAAGEYVETVRGVGYRFRDNP